MSWHRIHEKRKRRARAFKLEFDRVASMIKFSEDLYALVAANNVDEALDLLFNAFDDNFEQGSFYLCDRYLDYFDLDRLGLDLIVGVLSITFTSKHMLKRRDAFLDRSRCFLETKEPDRVDRILKGLR